jgi:hypothetical protein
VGGRGGGQAPSAVGGGGSKVGSDGWSAARFLDDSAGFGGKACRSAKSAAHGPDASGVAVASGSVGVWWQSLRRGKGNSTGENCSFLPVWVKRLNLDFELNFVL